ncbi:hypothetical protein ACSBR1_037272 [Camellia fascicularis]
MAMAHNTTTVQVKVGVVLGMNTWVVKMGLKCISVALSDLYSSHPYFKTRLDLHVKDSKDNVVGAAATDPNQILKSFCSLIRLPFRRDANE